MILLGGLITFNVLCIYSVFFSFSIPLCTKWGQYQVEELFYTHKGNLYRLYIHTKNVILSEDISTLLL